MEQQAQEQQQQFQGTLQFELNYPRLGFVNRLKLFLGYPIIISLGIYTENQAGNCKAAYNNLFVGKPQVCIQAS